MKALILNSGTGSRMGEMTKAQPKCMTEIVPGETILSRQLRQLQAEGIRDIVITTGLFDEAIRAYCGSLALDLRYAFVNNPLYAQTNYIYSMQLAKAQLENTALLLLHGDLVFEQGVLHDALRHTESCMTVSSTLPLPQKDFKAVVQADRILRVGIDFFEDAMAAQPLYRLLAGDWALWQAEIDRFCREGNTGVYAENALNEITERLTLRPLDVQDRLCGEIDTIDDLNQIRERMAHDGK